MSRAVNVLAVLDAAIQRAADDAKQYKFADKDGAQLREARAAVAELIEAAKAASDFLAVSMPHRAADRNEAVEVILPRLAAALARCHP